MNQQDFNNTSTQSAVSQSAVEQSAMPAPVPPQPTQDGEETIANALGFAKHIIGMCVDEEPHDAIRRDLWELVDMLRRIIRRAAAPAVEVCGLCGNFLDDKGYCSSCQATAVEDAPRLPTIEVFNEASPGVCKPPSVIYSTVPTGEDATPRTPLRDLSDADIKAIAERCTAQFLPLEHRRFAKQGKKMDSEQIDAGLRIIAVEEVIVKEIIAALRAATPEPRTPLRDLVDKWRLEAAPDVKSRRTTPRTLAQRKCADELEAALRASTPQPRTPLFDRLTKLREEFREMEKQAASDEVFYTRNGAETDRACAFNRRMLYGLFCNKLNAALAHPQGED